MVEESMAVTVDAMANEAESRTIGSPEAAVLLPPTPPNISFEDQHCGLDEQQSRGKQVLTTVQWLLDRVQESQSAFSKLDQEFRSFKREADRKIWEQEQKEDLLEHRFELMEGAIKKMPALMGGMSPMRPGTSATAGDMAFSIGSPTAGDMDPGDPLSPTANDGSASPPVDQANLGQSGNLTNLGQSFGGADPQLAASVADLEAEVRTMSFALKKVDNHIKHQEQVQFQKDAAQDELQRMEVAKMNRDIDLCLKEKELEAFRTIIMSKLGHLEAEAKEDAERSGKALKENLSEKMMEVQSSIERIAESAAQQMRLIDEKIIKNDAADAEREVRRNQDDAAMRRQVTYLASHVGADPEVMAQQAVVAESGPSSSRDDQGSRSGSRSGTRGAPPGGGLPPAPPPGGGLPPPGPPSREVSGRGGGAGKTNGFAGNGLLEQRVDEIERRLSSLDGAGPPNDAGDVAAVAAAFGAASPDGSFRGASPPISKPGSRPSSRGEPLPQRVERLEDKHIELVETLEDTLGIRLDVSDKEDAPGPGEEAQPGPDSNGGERSNRSRGGQDRLSALEARIDQLAASVGVELPPPVSFGLGNGAAGGRPELAFPPPDSTAPAGSTNGPAASRVPMIEAKLDEIASALGLTPEELESFARSENRGSLAGRVVLRDEGAGVSPRMAGMIAGQEDRIGQMDTRMAEQFRDFDDKFMNAFDKSDLRIRKLEDLQGIAPPAAPVRSGANLDNLEKRMQGIVSEDLNDQLSSTGGGGAAKAKAKPAAALGGGAQPPTIVQGARGATDGGTGGEQALVNRENEELLAAMTNEVHRLAADATDIKARIKGLDTAIEAIRAGAPAPVVQAALSEVTNTGGGGGSSTANIKLADAAKKAAKDAALSAEECQRLKEELAEIVNAVNIPSVGAMEDSMFDEPVPVDGEDLDLDDEVRDDAARQYVERQTVMEARLKQLEEQIDSASVVMPESQIFSSLKFVIKDVRRCLSRCELLYQLPEIKMFVKRFQRSLEVNAILHEKWQGPAVGAGGGGRRQLQEEDRPQSAGGSNLGAEDQNMSGSRSAPNLHKGRAGTGGPGKSRDGVKKKPFRTVVDWCRPHTPLKIDPVFKGGGERGEERASRGGERATPHLPQIK